MATSGSFKTNTLTEYGVFFYVTVSWSLVSQSVANNTSTISYSAVVTTDGPGYKRTCYARDLTINGTTVKSATGTVSYGSGTTIFSGSTTITHDSDGGKDFSASFRIQVGRTSYNVTGSGSWSLPTIARASSISSITGGSELGNEQTINISRKSSNFTHKVEYSFAGSAWSTIANSATTSAVFTPQINLCRNIPNSTTGTLTIRVTTMNGSSQVGSAVTSTKTLSVPSSVVPVIGSIGLSRIDNGVPSSWGVYVKGYSKCTITMNSVTGAYDSTITSYSISGGGLNSNTSSATTEVLNSSGTITFTCKVTDSRGRTTSKTASISVVDYYKPSLSLSAERCTSDGTPNASAGTYAKVTVNYDFASVSGKNSITSKKAICNGVSNTTFSDNVAFVIAANISIGNSYEVTATVTDALGNSDTKSVSISSATRIWNVKANKKGMGIGKFAEEDNTLDVAWQIVARQGYHFPNTEAWIDAYYTDPVNPSYNLATVISRSANSNLDNLAIHHAFYFEARENQGLRVNGKEIIYGNKGATFVKSYRYNDVNQPITLLNNNDNYIYIGYNSGLSTVFQYDVLLNSGLNIIGKTRFYDGWIGFYESNSNALNATNRKAWIGFSGTNKEFFFDIENGGEIKFLKTPVDPADRVLVSSQLRSHATRIERISQISGSKNYMEIITPNRSQMAWGIDIWASDKRLKKNIEDTKVNGIEIIKQIHHVSFDWKDSEKHETIGYVADEVEEIFPDAVFEVGEDKNKQISNTTITPLISKALQELIGIVEDQKKEIDLLKEEISLLKEVLRNQNA